LRLGAILLRVAAIIFAIGLTVATLASSTDGTTAVAVLTLAGPVLVLLILGLTFPSIGVGLLLVFLPILVPLVGGWLTGTDHNAIAKFMLTHWLGLVSAIAVELLGLGCIVRGAFQIHRVTDRQRPNT
jgi:hypothetical protein